MPPEPLHPRALWIESTRASRTCQNSRCLRGDAANIATRYYACNGYPSVEERRLALVAPACLVVSRERLQIRRRRRWIVDPAAQQIAPVDHVDRGPVLLVLVGKVAPDCVIRPQPTQSFERERE